jgi:hypothetical protein
MNSVCLPLTKQIDTKQLSKELGGVSISFIDDELRFVGDIDEKTAKKALADHVPAPADELSIDEKLANAGLNLQDLKTALGL